MIDYIDAFSNKYVSIDLNISRQNISVIVDIDDRIRETNESNNMAAKSPATIFSINLFESWNLISIPLSLISPKISDLFETINYSKILTFNEKWSELDGNYTINNTLAYWIRSNENTTLVIEGTELDSVDLSLKQGWNLIGFPNLTSSLINKTLTGINYSAIYSFNNTWSSYFPKRPLNSLEFLNPGYGYWTYIN